MYYAHNKRKNKLLRNNYTKIFDMKSKGPNSQTSWQPTYKKFKFLTCAHPTKLNQSIKNQFFVLQIFRNSLIYTLRKSAINADSLITK